MMKVKRKFVEILFVTIFIIFSVPNLNAIEMKIYGMITDSQTKEILPEANIYIEGTYRGSISNEDGEYFLKINSLPAKVIVSYIGYENQELILKKSDNLGQKGKKINFELNPSTIILEELNVEVSGEDPAMEIMRKVIENKEKMNNELISYSAKAFNRLSMTKKDQIVSISEAISRIYWSKEEGRRELILDNINSGNVETLGAHDFPDLSTTEASFMGSTFIHPVSPSAMDYYKYELIGEKVLEGNKIFEIDIIPSSIFEPLYEGKIFVIDEEFVAVDISINFPEDYLWPAGIESFDVIYKQKFHNFGTKIWLPIYTYLEMDAKINSPLIEFPQMNMKLVSNISDYEVNKNLELKKMFGKKVILFKDKLDSKKKLSITDKGDKNIENIVLEEELIKFENMDKDDFKVIPLTAKEESAYETIDSSWTLVKIFEPTGLLSGLVKSQLEDAQMVNIDRGEEKIKKIENFKYDFGLPELWYNRVDEMNIGINFSLDLYDYFQIETNTGYKTGLEKVYYDTELRGFYTGNIKSKNYIFFNISDYTRTTYNSWHYNQMFTSVLQLFAEDDYFDYYENRRVGGGINYRYKKFYSNFKLSADFEKHSSVKKTTNYNLFNDKYIQRINPEVEDGNMNTLSFKYSYNNELKYSSQRMGDTKIELNIEYSSIDLLQSDFEFTKIDFFLDYKFKILRNRMLPNHIRTKIIGSTYLDDLPVQKLSAIDGRVQSYSPFGSIKSLTNAPFVGSKLAGVFLEYNFSTIPFELIGLDILAKYGSQVAIHGAYGKRWNRENSSGNEIESDEEFKEVGFSIGALFGYPKINFTYNIDYEKYYLGFNINL